MVADGGMQQPPPPQLGAPPALVEETYGPTLGARPSYGSLPSPSANYNNNTLNESTSSSPGGEYGKAPPPPPPPVPRDQSLVEPTYGTAPPPPPRNDLGFGDLPPPPPPPDENESNYGKMAPPPQLQRPPPADRDEQHPPGPGDVRATGPLPRDGRRPGVSRGAARRDPAALVSPHPRHRTGAGAPRGGETAPASQSDARVPRRPSAAVLKGDGG